ncbi:MAG: hypothetical protein H7319_23475 [Spirosoma sp.]|nr:hypothetical protein [Spirosoma sp.]
MIICGLKLTHDGAVAVIEDGHLVFSVEMEKRDNNPRFTGIDETSVIADILREHNYRLSDVDVFAVDGWGGTDQNELAIQPRLEVGPSVNRLDAHHNGVPFQLDVTHYEETSPTDNVLEAWNFEGLKIEGQSLPYQSYLHVTGHIMGAYCTSPFAAAGESSYVLVWDGGMYPRLYYVNADTKQIDNLGPLFLLIGNIYTIFSQHFGPFKVKSGFAKDNLSTAGKVMAYIALGEVRREMFPIFEQIYATHYNAPMGFANVFANEFKRRIANYNFSDEDILSSFHVFMEELLVEKLAKKIARMKKPGRNLCMAGGCALNIKWNSAVRSSGAFDGVYVPPFPNDSGSAVGVACAALFNLTGQSALSWNVYSGPMIVTNEGNADWKSVTCSVAELGKLLAESNEPVVFLNDRAELGPRALGNRSIVASPLSPAMKTVLNRAKKREDYRPISPICLESRAPDMFVPGTPDPYMLFDHLVKPEWLDRIPAICHLDQTARLQTIKATDNPVVTALIEAFEIWSGVPVICNTSANGNGTGFFPDVQSATVWAADNGLRYVWCDETLHEYIGTKPMLSVAILNQEVMAQ